MRSERMTAVRLGQTHRVAEACGIGDLACEAERARLEEERLTGRAWRMEQERDALAARIRVLEEVVKMHQRSIRATCGEIARIVGHDPSSENGDALIAAVRAQAERIRQMEAKNEQAERQVAAMHARLSTHGHDLGCNSGRYCPHTPDHDDVRCEHKPCNCSLGATLGGCHAE